MKENKTYVTQAPLDGSLGTDQYFLITVSPALYQCFSSVYMCTAKIFLSPYLLSLLHFSSVHTIHEPRTLKPKYFFQLMAPWPSLSLFQGSTGSTMS